MPPDPAPGGEPTPVNQSARHIPIEEINWKKRALDAEAALAAAQAEVQTLTDRCATHEKNIQSITKASEEARVAADRERLIAEALAPHHPLDAALCATLIERELERAGQGVEDVTPDLGAALGPIVGRLASERPYLFRASARAAPGATMAGEPGAPAHTPIEDALDDARSSGGRAQLLKYLRLRRGA